MAAVDPKKTREIFGALKTRDTAVKPTGADREWAELAAYYADQSRALTIKSLKAIGVGMKDQTHPIDLSTLMAQAIDRQATVYKRAPSRWLANERGRLPEDSAEHLQLLQILSAASADQVLKTMDRRRALLNQVAIRCYPSDERRCAILVPFDPHLVLRDPKPGCGDLMDEDRAFALELEGEVFELWYRLSDGAWAMAWVDKEGSPLPEADQPFRTERENRSPYARLPVQMIFSEHPGGKSWIPPRQSRLAWVRALNALANDTQALVHFQAWRQRVYKRRDPNNQIPADVGPGTTVAIDEGEELIDLPASTAMEACVTTIKSFAGLFAIGEHLPATEFDPAAQIQTGAALRVQLAPLLDRREDQVPLVVPDEQALWLRLVAVHNVHASAWKVAQVNPDLELELEVPDLEAPTTETERGNLAARQLAIGTASVIDQIQAEVGCTRAEAVKRYHRVQADFAAYPPRATPAAQGPQPTAGPTPIDAAPDAVLDGKASVMDAIRAAG